MTLLLDDLPDDYELAFNLGRLLREAMPGMPFSIRDPCGQPVYDRVSPVRDLTAPHPSS